MDEAYVNKKIQLVNGSIVGTAVDEDFPSSTIFSVMVRSLTSKYRDVITTTYFLCN